jgi:hypothetical protein
MYPYTPVAFISRLLLRSNFAAAAAALLILNEESPALWTASGAE